MDIHEFDRRLKWAERSIRDSNPISERNSELITKFSRSCKISGLSKARIVKYLRILRRLAEKLEKDFDEVTKEDIEDLVYWIETSDYSSWTKHDYKVTLKKFYKWLKEGNKEYPEEVKWISTTVKKKTLPEDLPTEEDIKRLVEAADNPRDRAFIMTLYESGGRIGEVGSLKIKDLEFKDQYVSVMLKGKTGSRKIPIITSAPYLSLWLEHHPGKEDPDAPLWPKFSDGEAMTYPALAKVLRVSAKRAGLKKKVNPHKLRHARATFLASKLTEAQMNQFFGWKQGSKMPSTYVHLSGRDIDGAVLGIYGLKSEEKEAKKVSPRDCPRCGSRNPSDSKFCSKCGLALDIEEAMEMESTEHKLVEKLGELKDKDLVEMLEFTSKLYRLAREDPEVADKLRKMDFD